MNQCFEFMGTLLSFIQTDEKKIALMYYATQRRYLRFFYFIWKERSLDCTSFRFPCKVTSLHVVLLQGQDKFPQGTLDEEFGMCCFYTVRDDNDVIVAMFVYSEGL